MRLCRACAELGVSFSHDVIQHRKVAWGLASQPVERHDLPSGFVPYAWW